MTLFAIILLMSVVLTGLLAHLVPFLADAGASSAEAAIASSLVGVAVLFGRVIVGYLFDRLFAPHVAIAFFALSAAGIGWLMVAPTGFSLYLACALVGLSVGAEIDFLAYVTGRYFGLRAFGGIYGLLMTASLAGGAIGSATLGFAFEWFGSYNPPLIAGLLLNAVAILLTATLDRYRDDNRRQRAQSMDQAADARS
jgi:predicted MFS family arabinose efflux permease